MKANYFHTLTKYRLMYNITFLSEVLKLCLSILRILKYALL